MAKAYYEFKDKASSKFWEIDTTGKTVTVRFGKIGTDGQTTVKAFATPAEATVHAAKVTAEKVKKGYKKKASAKGTGAKTTKPAKRADAATTATRAPRLQGADLVLAAEARRSVKSRDAIIEACGYDPNTDSICAFYDALVDALGFDRISPVSPSLRTHIFKQFDVHTKFYSPIVEDGTICGQYWLSIASADKPWTEETWQEHGGVEWQDGPYETARTIGHSAKCCTHFDFESAMAGGDYRPDIRDIVRPAYQKLADTECLDVPFAAFLREHGEHPKVLLDIAHELVPAQPTHYWRVVNTDKWGCEYGFEPNRAFQRSVRRKTGAIDVSLGKGTILALASIKLPRHLVFDEDSGKTVNASDKGQEGSLEVTIAEGLVCLTSFPSCWKPLSETEFKKASQKLGSQVYGINQIIQEYMQA